LIFGTVVAPRVVAIVPGLLLLYCGWEASLEATEISWLRCSSLGRLVVVFCDGLKRSFVRALCLCHNDRFRNLNHSIP
jgi:hypothetical protein